MTPEQRLLAPRLDHDAFRHGARPTRRRSRLAARLESRIAKRAARRTATGGDPSSGPAHDSTPQRPDAARRRAAAAAAVSFLSTPCDTRNATFHRRHRLFVFTLVRS